MGYLVHFRNGTVYRACYADTKKDALEEAWVVVLNAIQYNQNHTGYESRIDLIKNAPVTKDISL
jgi:hypothetical protein